MVGICPMSDLYGLNILYVNMYWFCCLEANSKLGVSLHNSTFQKNVIYLPSYF